MAGDAQGRGGAVVQPPVFVKVEGVKLNTKGVAPDPGTAPAVRASFAGNVSQIGPGGRGPKGDKSKLSPPVPGPDEGDRAVAKGTVSVKQHNGPAVPDPMSVGLVAG